MYGETGVCSGPLNLISPLILHSQMHEPTGDRRPLRIQPMDLGANKPHFMRERAYGEYGFKIWPHCCLVGTRNLPNKRRAGLRGLE